MLALPSSAAWTSYHVKRYEPIMLKNTTPSERQAQKHLKNAVAPSGCGEPSMDSKLSREDHIYYWKTEGGNLTWARWCAIEGIPVKNQEYHNELKAIQELAKGRKPGAPGIVLKGRRGS